MENNLKKNFFWNTLGSLVNSFSSLFFLIIVTRINGTNSAGIFTFAFSNACLLQVIGTYAGRSFQVTEKNNNINDNDYVHNRLLSSLTMIIIGILFGLLKGYETIKISVVILLVLYKALDAFSESLYGILQKNEKLYQVGISLFLKGILGIIVFLITDLLTKNIIVSILSLITINSSIILFYDFKCIKKCDYKLSKINLNSTLLIFKLGFWTFLFTFLTQYLINAPKYSIDNYLSNEVQTIYGIIAMPATLVLLLSNFLVQPFLMKISNYVKNNEFKKLNNILFKMIFILIILSLLAEIFLYLFGIFFLNLLYGIDIAAYLKDLLIIFGGATLYGITILISNVLIAMRKTMSQTVIFVIDSIITYFICKFLIIQRGINGASCSYLYTMFILLILYFIIYFYSIRKEMKK